MLRFSLKKLLVTVTSIAIGLALCTAAYRGMMGVVLNPRLIVMLWCFGTVMIFVGILIPLGKTTLKGVVIGTFVLFVLMTVAMYFVLE